MFLDPYFKVGDWVRVKHLPALDQEWAEGLFGQVVDVTARQHPERGLTVFYLIDSDVEQHGIWEYNLVPAEPVEDMEDMENAWAIYRDSFLSSGTTRHSGDLRKREFCNGWRASRGIGVRI